MSDKDDASPTLKLAENRLVSSSYKFISQLVTGPIEVPENYLKTTSRVSKSTKEIRVFLEFAATPKEKTSELFRLEATYYGLFKVSDSTTFEQAESFAKANAPAIVFPLLRAAIATLTLSSGFPPLTLPVINFHKVSVNLEIID